MRLPGGALLTWHTQAGGRAETVLGQHPGFRHPCKPCQVLFTAKPRWGTDNGTNPQAGDRSPVRELYEGRLEMKR